MTLKVFINLIRYKNYIKNLIIFLPLFLNNTSWSVLSYINLIGPVIFFSFLASSIYIINDIRDLDLDKKHIEKKHRPIPSGKISIKSARLVSYALGLVSLLYFIIFSNPKILAFVLAYFVLNILYSYHLKKIKYLDLLIISSGFIIRIFIGSIISNVILSNFLLLQILFFSIFILICKRRENYFSYGNSINSIYSIKELNILSKSFLILNILNYFIYIFEDSRFTHSLSIEFSFIIFSFLIFRYYINTMKNINFDPISIFFSDKYLVIFSGFYLLNFILGFYGYY